MQRWLVLTQIGVAFVKTLDKKKLFKFTKLFMNYTIHIYTCKYGLYFRNYKKSLLNSFDFVADFIYRKNNNVITITGVNCTKLSNFNNICKINNLELHNQRYYYEKDGNLNIFYQQPYTISRIVGWAETKIPFKTILPHFRDIICSLSSSFICILVEKWK